MADSYQIIGLLKFGSKKDIMDLLENGTIYMNSIQKFRNLEDNELRGDNFEGISKIRNLPSGHFEIPKLNYKWIYISVHIRETYENVLGNIYSLYCISSHDFPNPKDFFIHEKVKDFGSHFIFIKNLPKFFYRIRSYFKNQNLKFYEGFVKYYDEKEINDHISVFQKSNRFEYQKEFRFYIERESVFPFSFQIGNIKDIAEIFPIENASELSLIKKN